LKDIMAFFPAVPASIGHLHTPPAATSPTRHDHGSPARVRVGDREYNLGSVYIGRQHPQSAADQLPQRTALDGVRSFFGIPVDIGGIEQDGAPKETLEEDK
jgi:hypothetical protein